MFYPPPPPPPKQGRTFAGMIFMTLASLIFGGSLILNVYLLVFTGIVSGASSTSSRQTTILEGDASQKIAVIPIAGIIMDAQAAQFERFIKMAEDDMNVKAVILAVDSPGGSVTASDEIHHRVTAFKQKRNIPVVISMGSLAASGGYYIACAGDHVIAEPTTLTGNIGVLLPSYNVAKLADKWGIEETTLHSSGADFKNAGSMFHETVPTETAYFQDIIDQAFVTFKKVVKDGRTSHTNFVAANIDQVANGKIYTAKDAMSLGLIDQVGYAADAYASAQTLAKLSKPQVVQYHNPPSFLEALSSKSNVGALHAQSGVGLDASGVTVKLDWQSLQEMATPRLLYLWRGQ